MSRNLVHGGDSKLSAADDEATDRRLLTRRAMLARMGTAGASVALSGTLAGPAFARVLAETKKSTLRIALNASAPSLDCAFSNGSEFVPGLVNEPLVTIDPSGSGVIPWLASSYKAVSPSHYVFKIREGVKFSDGSPLTADDVVYSLARNLPNSGLNSQLGAAYYANVESIHRTGKHEVTVRLKQPDVTFLYLAPVYTLIVKESFTKPRGKNYARPGGKMLGTGPFELTHYDSTRISFAASSHHWRKPPAVRAIDFQVITDPQSQLLAMRSGSIDAAYDIGPSVIDQYSSIPGVSFTGSLGASYYLSFDVTASPWSDVHVRRAIAHCWDAHGFVRGPLRGRGQASDGIVFPWQWRSVMTKKETTTFFKSLPKYKFSLAAARSELAKSATPRGFSASISYPSSSPEMGLALQSIAANLQQIGVTLNVTSETATAWGNQLASNKNLGMFIIEFLPDYDDANDFLSICYDSAYAVPNGWNTAHLRNSRVDHLLAVEQATTKRSVRAKAMREIYQISARELPYLGLWYEEVAVAARHPFHIKGFTPMFYISPWVYEVAV